jgi:hypothetical protein
MEQYRATWPKPERRLDHPTRLPLWIWLCLAFIAVGAAIAAFT